MDRQGLVWCWHYDPHHRIYWTCGLPWQVCATFPHDYEA
jgi:hypothetical protein